MLYAEIQFVRPMKLPSMTRSGTRLTDVRAEPSEAGLLIGRAFVPWVHVLFAAAPPYQPNDPFALPPHEHLASAFIPDVPPPPGDHLRVQSVGPGNTSSPNEGAPVSASDKPSRRGNSKRAGQPDKP